VCKVCWRTCSDLRKISVLSISIAMAWGFRESGDPQHTMAVTTDSHIRLVYCKMPSEIEWHVLMTLNLANVVHFKGLAFQEYA
jgi:hypothetical protein